VRASGSEPAAGKPALRASIGEVAQLAGVSVATVSRAVRGLPNVSPATRERVLRAAEQLQYVPIPPPAVGRTMTVGMAVPLLAQWFIAQVVAGAEGVLAASGYDVLIYSVPDDEAKQRFVDRLPLHGHVDGLIAVDLPFLPSEVERLSDQDIPLVTVGTSYDCAPSVTIDNLDAAARATRHLVDLGHRRIGMISHLPPQALPSVGPLLRREGYEGVLAEAGITVREELIVPGNFALQGGAEAMAQLLAVDRPPTAVFAQSDEMAIGAIKAARDTGLRVPADLSVIGFDDAEPAARMGLTTVRQPTRRKGELAATALLGLLAGRAPPPVQQLPTELVVRTSTGPAPN
jgi:LacI family transcriptional regulator, repressor for deo operon, udp, cdd, tsx, nupC, and nupG